MKEIKGWKKYEKNPLDIGSDCFYQKIIYIGDEKIGINILEYTFNETGEGRKSWEVRIQIPEEFSISKKTMNVEIFSYSKLDFNLVEKQAKKVINKLTKP